MFNVKLYHTNEVIVIFIKLLKTDFSELWRRYTCRKKC